ncbi:MAG: response regulator transcription factor [Chitinophagaceae bacterium]|nr:response regulator transcription factor [Chitinophagaceae bacterium]
MDTADKIRVLIFEDNEHFADSLEILLDQSDNFMCAGVCKNAKRLKSDITTARPGIILMDIEMPGVSGIEAVLLSRNYFPGIPVLMLTAFDDDEKIFQSLRAGGSGYIVKSATTEQLLQAIIDVYQGGSAFSPGIARRIANFFQQEGKNSLHEKLTPKEKEVLQHLVNGKSYKLIAAGMSISFETVKSHIKNIYTKLHVNNNTEAVAKALRDKLV